MKRCCRCGPKPISAFASNKSRKDGLQPYCRTCHSNYTKKHYLENVEPYKRRAKAQRKHLQEILRLSKEGKKCADCERKFPPCAMDYDHLDARTKDTEVALLTTCDSEAKLLREIAKCELVCAVCHRIRTEKRRLST